MFLMDTAVATPKHIQQQTMCTTVANINMNEVQFKAASGYI